MDANWAGYGLAVASATVALVIRTICGHWFAEPSTFLFFAPAVMLSAWYGGFGPGMFCTMVGAAVADYFLLEPVGKFSSSTADLPRIVVFLLVGAQISWLSGALRAAKRRAERDTEIARRNGRLLAAAREQLQAAHDELEARVRQRTTELEFQKSLLEAQSNASLDGILAVAEDQTIIYVNRRIANLWNLPGEAFGGGLADAVTAMRSKLVEPRNPLDERGVLQMRGDGEPPLNLILTDGRTLECYSAPIRSNDGKNYGRVWFFRDITERKKLSKQVLEAGELERQRIGQDLHDDLCQQLTGIACLGRVLQQRLAARLPAEVANAAQIVEMTEQATQRARDLAKGLQPVELRGGLGSALAELTSQFQKVFQVACHFRGESWVSLADPAAPIHLYRIAQEAMHNAIRHGQASNVYVDLIHVGSRAILTVEDDGVGIHPMTPSHGLGLRTMRHRARLIGAALTIERAAERGTIVRCQLPCETGSDVGEAESYEARPRGARASKVAQAPQRSEGP